MTHLIAPPQAPQAPPGEPAHARADRLLRVLIVDDEPLACLRLRGLLAQAQVPNAVVGEFHDGESARLELLAHPGAAQAVDLILADIRMPGLDGLSLARELRQAGLATALVFTTAHGEHALQAFDVHALDYLTKPVRLQRLDQALVKVARHLGWPAAQLSAEPEPAATPAGTATPPNSLWVSERGRLQRIEWSEVLYLRAELKYVTLRTRERAWVLDDSLAELETKAAGRLLRIHRNALVAAAAIDRLERRAVTGPTQAGDDSEPWCVHIGPTGEWLSVSRRQLSVVRQALPRLA